MASKIGKRVASAGKSKKAASLGKSSERVPAGGGTSAPLTTFEDDDMYQEPTKKVRYSEFIKIYLLLIFETRLRRT